MDFTKFGRDAQLHFARLALFRFQEERGTWPALHDEKDAKLLVEYGNALLKAHNGTGEDVKDSIKVDSIDEKIFHSVSLYARTEITSLAALMGGVLAQEIVKQTGKFTPIDQWFHLDAFELLSATVPSDATPPGSRYDHSIAIFGKAFQEKVEKQNLFMVGCGALGCEYLKMIAMTGLGTRGTVHITDDDRIELSNLSRQFLFRREHVGKSKSECSSKAAMSMNHALTGTIRAHEVKVMPETEAHFSKCFC
jgi:ubiquitin-activating enzyme E1